MAVIRPDPHPGHEYTCHMSHQSATASTFYYKRNTFFTVLVYISVIGCIASIVQCIFGILAGWNFTSMVLNGTTAIFGLSWDIQILRKKDFFYSGNLTKKCSPWLILAASRLFLGVVLVVLNDLTGIEHLFAAVLFTITFLCYRYWSFCRPWKQVQQIPVYMVQQTVMMPPPSPVMVHQQPPMMAPQYSAPQQYHTQPIYPKN